MRDEDLSALSVAELGAALRAGRITAGDLAEWTLDNIAASNDRFRAFVLVDADGAMQAAAAADAELRRGICRGPMHGIPYGLKDIYDVQGLPTSCSSRLMPRAPCAEDSEVAARFRAGGAVLVGKLTTHEFAIGTPTESTGVAPARNPWNTAHIPGGSSSGSGSAVGGGLLRLATATDTAGSIRGPAAWCGAVGLKPTYGRVSRRGVFPLAWTMDHCGPIAASVEDAAIALQVMAGHDPADAASVAVAVDDYRAGLHRGVEGMRIGVPRNLFEGSPLLGEEARANIERTIAKLRERGARVEDMALPDMDMFSSCGRIILAAEMFSVHRAMLRERGEDYHPLTFSRIAVGGALDAADYLDALRVRGELMRATASAFAGFDAMLTAISLDSAPASSLGFKGRDWPLQPIMFNVTGHPAMSVPTGLDSRGLPMGVQLVGHPFDEARLLRVAKAVENDSTMPPAPLGQHSMQPAFA